MYKKIKSNIPPLLFMIFMAFFLMDSSSVDEEEAEERITGFYTDSVPEIVSDRLLLEAGKGIVPYLIVKIQDKDMPRRAYAMGALINLEARRAVPVLRDIFNDHSDWDRFTALEAIWYLDKELGEELIAKHYEEGEYDEEADDIIAYFMAGNYDDVYVPMICRQPFLLRFIPASCKIEFIF
jgi:hypothetical protein